VPATYNSREEIILGHFTKRGMLRYKDTTAYFCTACECIINVSCPKCKSASGKGHATTSVFRRVEDTYEWWDGIKWVKIECRKCDYQFKVIAR
jgi:hypothetical protein